MSNLDKEFIDTLDSTVNEFVDTTDRAINSFGKVGGNQESVEQTIALCHLLGIVMSHLHDQLAEYLATAEDNPSDEIRAKISEAVDTLDRSLDMLAVAVSVAESISGFSITSMVNDLATVFEEDSNA